MLSTAFSACNGMYEVGQPEDRDGEHTNRSEK